MSWAEEHYGWADEEDFKQTTSKRRRNMTTQAITVAAVTKEPKVWNDETCWGVKVGNGWMDLYVKDRPSKGQTFNVEVEDVEWKGRPYKPARPVKGSQPAAAPAKDTRGADGRAGPTDLRHLCGGCTEGAHFGAGTGAETRCRTCPSRIGQHVPH